MINKIADAIKAGHSFIIATHINPDGDALGSAFALAMALKSIGKKVHVFDRDKVPDTYTFLPGADMLHDSIKGVQADTLILVDCNNLTRAASDGCPKCKMNLVIDHHETEGEFGDIKWIEPKIPATGVMIKRLIDVLGVAMTPDIAQNLYTAIALDTGTFRYSNTTPESLHIGAELTEAGANPALVANRLYSNWSMNRFDLFQQTIATMQIEDKICFTKVSVKMLHDTSTSQADTESFVNFPLRIDSVKASVLLKETEDGKWKASMRSKGVINVAAVAEKFGGGGHKNAAGCTVDGQFDQVKYLLMKELTNP